MNRDWTGNATAIFATHGASNHSERKRSAHDFYATDPVAVEALLKKEKCFTSTILEPCCGEGHISEVLRNHGHTVYSYDIVQRNYIHQLGTQDFLSYRPMMANRMDIITNPPYAQAADFVGHALDISATGVKVAMLLKLTFLEGKKRKRLFDIYPPETIYVFRERIDCWPNGIKPSKMQHAVCYGWFVWKKGFEGNPQISWIDMN